MVVGERKENDLGRENFSLNLGEGAVNDYKERKR